MKFKRIVAVLLVLVTVFAIFAIPVSAAKSGSNKTANIYVTTKANWLKPGKESITLTPKAGVDAGGCKFTNCSWSVKVYKYGTGTTKYYTLKGSSSLKINLDRNANYQITVTPTASYRAICEIEATSGKLRSYPSWYVSSTCKVSSVS